MLLELTGGAWRKRERLGDTRVKWILWRHPLPEDPPPNTQYYALSYPGLKSQATPRLRYSPQGGGRGSQVTGAVRLRAGLRGQVTLET